LGATAIAKALSIGRASVYRALGGHLDPAPRPRAVIAFTILTGARDGAVASLKLKHVDIHQGRVDQDARQVKTKFSKSFTTWFLPVGDDIRRIVVDWVDYLRQEQLWGLDDAAGLVSVDHQQAKANRTTAIDFGQFHTGGDRH
jgi:hypothetical protein